jgi:amino acid transporter
MSFREKSLWVMVAALLLASFFYGHAVAYVSHEQFETVPWHAMRVLAPMVVLFHVAVAVLVLFAVVGHAVIALLDRRTTEDERDRLIALKGARVGGIVLAVGVFLALWLAVASTGNFWFTQILLGFWVMAQLTDYTVQLNLHKRDA